LSHESGAYGKQLPYVMTIPWNQSINGFFIRQFLDERILSGATHWHWLIYFCSSILLATTLCVVFRRLRQDAHGVSMAAALILLVILLIAPLTWQHHFVFAMPAVICCFAFLAKLREGRYKSIVTLSTVALAIIISFPPLISAIFPNLAAMKMMDKVLPLGANLVISAQLLAGLGFWGLFCVLVSSKGGMPSQIQPD